MSIKKPFKRTARQFTDEKIKNGGLWYYILDKEYAQSPEHFIRAYLIIQKDFLVLLDYIEPSDRNLNTYSYRIHELLLRVCIEIESNFVAILSENGYKKKGNWNLADFKKVNKSHRLSSYRVKLPIWKGVENVRMPFEKLESDDSMPWWNAYNKTKHNRHIEFEKATFRHLTDAMCALITILTAQFTFIEFSIVDNLLLSGDIDPDGMENAIGSYFRVEYPKDWPEEEKYDFDWEEVKNEKVRFNQFLYK